MSITAFTRATASLLHLTAEKLVGPKSWKARELQRDLDELIHDELTGIQKHHLLFLEELLRLHLNVYGARSDLHAEAMAITREPDSEVLTLWNRNGSSLVLHRDDVRMLRDMLNDVISGFPVIQR